MADDLAMIDVDDVVSWQEAVDVAVVGLGIAGACAALEAHATGAEVLVLERSGGGGGSSIVSSGIFYLGGGTPVQEAAGFADDPDNMYRFLMASTGAPDAEIVRAYCQGNVEHFEWLEAQGVPFERTYFPGKSVILTTTTCLFSTGSEKVWPFREVARPVPRGHKVAGAGEHAGAVGMNAILDTVAAQQVPVSYETHVTGLVVDGTGRVVGVRARKDRTDLFVRARRGVVIGTGGFNFNGEMLAEHVPLLSSTAVPLGVPFNDGSGIRLGAAAGGALRAMSGIIPTGSFYPPSKLIKGILVNRRGERFVAEDSYHGRTGNFVMEQPGQKAYLVVDAESFAYPKITAHRHKLVDGWESVEEMEAALDLPKGALVATLEAYNQAAEEHQDPQFHKHPDYVQPLTSGPWAAFDVSFDSSSYLYMTLGGLRTNADAEVVDLRGVPVPGLYAAGACASTIAQDGKGYGSGMSLGPGSFFGRVAGRRAAAATPVTQDDEN
jgi:3-oxo-5alpha-steroid 4-dehydrogenase